MQCPACQVDLVMSERQSIEIDYCPKCRGVWLDRGELDKIIEKSANEATPAPRAPEPRYQEPRYQEQPRYQEPRYEPRRDEGYRDGYKKPHRRKSWLEEIFD
jgi:Zn-finger nucleic acid-binding protein